jgi:hypothetical protein
MSFMINPFRFGGGGGGGGGGGADIQFARYWRIRVIENYSFGSTPAISADNIEMRATSGGADQTGTASNAISDSEFSGSFLDDYAFNGTGGGFWVSSNAGGTYGTHWIGYDFGAGNEVEVREIVWSKRPDSFGQNESPVVGLVEYSDDNVTWTISWSFYTPATWGTGAETRTFTAPTGGGYLFWRIRATAVQGGSTFPWGTGELEFKETAGGADQAAGGYPQSSPPFSGVVTAVNAFDNNNTTNFDNAATIAGGINWVGYTFPSYKAINEVTIQARNNTNGQNECITAGVVESSIDRTTWTTEWSFTTPATWVTNSTEVRTFTRP